MSRKPVMSRERTRVVVLITTIATILLLRGLFGGLDPGVTVVFLVILACVAFALLVLGRYARRRP